MPRARGFQNAQSFKRSVIDRAKIVGYGPTRLYHFIFKPVTGQTALSALSPPG